MSTDFFPIAVWHSGGKARAPMLSPITADSTGEWRAELEQIRDLGFNTVRTWVPWSDCEPREGDFHFENLELLCELADEVGLRVSLQVYAEAMPVWFSRKFANAAFVTQSGERLESQVAPGVCTDCAGVRDGVLNFYRAAARVATRCPAFLGWDLWSEPHIVNWTIVSHVPNVQFCFCPHTVARFREWLREKYESLEVLSQSWNRTFASWDEVEPPRFGTILTYTDLLDWKQFIYAKMAADLKMRTDAVREVDPDHIVTSHAAVPSGMTSPMSEWAGYGATDDFLMADTVDRYGLSLYPKHSFPNRHWERWKIDYALDFAHSANAQHGGFTVGELQAGPGARGTIVGDPITAADHRRWIWTAVARGAKMISLYAYHPMTSGYEAGGYGLIHHDGSVTERAKESGKIARTIGVHADLFANAQPVPAQVAIVYNPLAQLAGGEQSSGSHLLHPDSLVGYHRIFAERGVPVEFIHRRDLESEDLSQYQLIIVPHPLVITHAAAAGLRRFVEQGGSAIAEARLALSDERGFTSGAIPGLGLDEVFGARESWVRMGEEIAISLPDATLTGAHFAEGLTPLPNRKTETVARFADGSSAIVTSRFGQGQTMLIGTFLGLANRKQITTANRRFTMSLLDWANVDRPFTTSMDDEDNPTVAAHLQECREEKLLFLINHSANPERIAVNLIVGNNGPHTVRNLIDGEAHQINAGNGTLIIDRNLDGDEVQALLINPA